MPKNNDGKVKIFYETVYDDNGAKKAKQDIAEVKNGAAEAAKSGVKWAVLGQAISKVATKIADAAKISADYIETLNLLDVAFEGNTENIRKFADTLSETLNLDDSTILRSAAHFKVLSQSMGLASETGEKLSKLMTQMTLDVSSLYNIDFDKAQRALQYAMEGRGTSLKQRTGVSVLESSVQAALDTLGVDAYVESMTDAEKAIARVIAMEYQLMQSQGDLARTIEAPANQMRVMKEQLSLLARNIGNVFIPIVAKLLPYLNAVLIVLNAIISVIARLVGYKEDMFDVYTEPNTIEYFDGVGAAIDGVGDSAARTAKKLQGLRGFDKLNVIKSPTDTGGGGGGAGGGLGGINPNLLKAFNSLADQYKAKLDEIETKATKIANKILDWLGFAKKDGKWVFEKVKPGTVLATIITVAGLGLKIKQIYDFLKKIGLIKGTFVKSLINLAELFKSGTVAKNIGTFAKAINTIAKALGMSSGGLILAAAAFIAIAAAVIHAYTHIEKFKEKVDNAFGSVGKLLGTIVKKFIEFKDSVQPTLDEIFKVIKVPFEQAWENIQTILGFMYDGVVGTFSAIADVIDGVAKIITDIINGDFDKAFKDLGNMVKNVKEDWDEYWEKIKTRFDEWKAELLTKIENWKEKVKTKFDEIPEKLNELPEKAGEAIGKMITKIKTKVDNTDWKAVGKKIVTIIKDGMLEQIPSIASTIAFFPIYLLKGVAEISWDLWNVGREIINGITRGMVGFISNGGLLSVAHDIVRGLKEGLGIHSPAKLILDAKIGDFSMEAIAEGMERQLGLIDEQANGIVETLDDGIKNAAANAKINASVVPTLEDTAINSSVLAGLGSNSFVQNQGQLSKDISGNNGGIKNATFVIQVGNKEIAKQVITDLQDMAKDNGKPITIGG